MLTLNDEMQFIIEPEIRRYCGPLFFSYSLETAKGNINSNGTFALVDTGKRKLLVTCYHVLEDFQKFRREHPELQFCVCLDLEVPIVFDTNQVIDYNQKADLVTFDIGPLEKACRVRKFYRLDQNPAPSLKKGDQIVFVGYPGRFRFAEELKMKLGRILYGLTVADVSGRTILANISKTKATFSKEPRATPSVQQHGGTSGSPCFLVRSNRRLQLAAFVTSDGLGLLRLSHARCINADGTVNPPYP